MRILQIGTTDMQGGAETVARQLLQEYRRRGHHAWLAVGLKRSDDPDVLAMSDNAYRNRWARACIAVGDLLSPCVGRVRGAGWLRRLLQRQIGQPHRWLEIRQGKEDFDFPCTWHVLDLLPEEPDIVHCHNLHGAWLSSGGYFDLRALPWLSRQVPVILTLHDAWLLSGHCAHSFDCQRWETGCGQCPDLTIYPAICRDSTGYNWRRKAHIYAQSRLYVSTPCHWLMRKVERSMLASGIVEAMVIPNGVDLGLFHPGDQREARALLEIPQDAQVLLFVGTAARSNIWKDYSMLEAAVRRAAAQLPNERLLLICLGEGGEPEGIGRANVWLVGYQKDPWIAAHYYRAAGIYVHAARVDTFPTAVLEALACGTAVVATAVGGIAEQVKGLQFEDGGLQVAEGELNRYASDEATGVLVQPKDAEAMARAIVALLTNEGLRQRLGENAVQDARRRFDLERQAQAYLEWYQMILERSNVQLEAA